MLRLPENHIDVLTKIVKEPKVRHEFPKTITDFLQAHGYVAKTLAGTFKITEKGFAAAFPEALIARRRKLMAEAAQKNVKKAQV